MYQIKRIPYLIEFVTVIGLVFYIAQSWYFANSLDSIGDEGAYLYKGYMFARGTYYPFQEYTFWTNKAPLAFLIPGYIQLWFGPGLGVARYFAIFVSVLMLIGVWITARRLGGKGWAAVAVWVFALALAQVSVYSEAVSQGLVACLMAWMFVLTLGGDRPLWQLILGSALSILVVMTRQNMAVVPAFLVLYIFWQYGSRAGWWSLAACAILFTGFHILYWPGILQIWAPWLPSSLTPFLDRFRVSTQFTQTDFVFDASTLSRLQSFVTGVHDHFFIFCGSLSAVILWPKRESWKNSSQFKMAIFLGVTFFVLFLMHTLASLPTDYCVHCFSAYQAFYTTVGFFFILVVFSNGLNTSRSRVFLFVVSLLFFAASLGLYYYQRWGNWLLDTIPVPRLNRILRAAEFSTVSLKEVLTYTFNLSPEIQKRLVPAGAGLLLGLSLILLVWAIHRFLLSKIGTGVFPLTNIILVVCLFAGTALPVALKDVAGEENCSTHFLSYYEEAARTLSRMIPPGSLVYWKGSGRHLAFMLYMDDIKIFPPQIHAGGGYVVGDSQQLIRLGVFNQELDERWRQSADILIVWNTYMTKEFREFLKQPGYEPIPFDMGKLSKCEDELYVFRRTS
jgi:hypothetical protein